MIFQINHVFYHFNIELNVITLEHRDYIQQLKLCRISSYGVPLNHCSKMPRKSSYPTIGIFSVFIWIYTAARIFGFMLFAIEYNDKNQFSKVYVSICNVLWAIVAIAIYVFIVVVSIFQQGDILKHSNIEVLSMVMLNIGSSAITVASIIMDMVNRKRIFTIVTKLNEFDEQVSFK